MGKQVLHDDQISIGMQVEIQEPGRQPFNGAVGTVVDIRQGENGPYYVVNLYGENYNFPAYDLRKVEISG